MNDPQVEACQDTADRGGARIGLKTWGLTGVLALLTVALIAVGATRKKATPTIQPKTLSTVEVFEVVAREHREKLVLPARIQADRQAVISSELNGRLEKWLVEEGDPVEAGQVVALINTDDLQARLSQLKAQMGSAASGVAVAERQLEMAKIGLQQAQKDAAALQLELASAKADEELAAKDYERIKALAAQSIASEANLDAALNKQVQARLKIEKALDTIARADIGIQTAGAKVAEAEALAALARDRVAEADSQIAALEVNLRKAVLRAPLAGRLEEHLKEAGEVVSAGMALAHLYDLTHVRAIVDVADRYAPFLDTSAGVGDFIAMSMPGASQAVSAKLILPGLPKLTGGTYAGLELPATLVRIAQAADPASNTFRVELRLPNPGQALKQGMIAQAEIDYLYYPKAIVIPVRAVQVSEVGPRVLVVERRGERYLASGRDIEPISIAGQWLLVGGGLTAGELLIASGGRGVVPGEEVKVIQNDATPPSSPEGGQADRKGSVAAASGPTEAAR